MLSYLLVCFLPRLLAEESMKAEKVKHFYDQEVAHIKSQLRALNVSFLDADEGVDCTALSFEAKNQLREAKLNYDLQLSFQGPSGEHHRPTWRKEVAILKRSYEQEVRSIKRRFCTSNSMSFDLQGEYEKRLAQLRAPVGVGEVGGSLAVQPTVDGISAATMSVINEIPPWQKKAERIEEGLGNLPETLLSEPAKAAAMVHEQRVALEWNLHAKLKAVQIRSIELTIQALANASVQLDALDSQELRILLDMVMNVSRPVILSINRCKQNASVLHKKAHLVMKPLYHMGDKPQDQADRLNDRANDAKDAVFDVANRVIDGLQDTTEGALQRAEDGVRTAALQRAEIINRILMASPQPTTAQAQEVSQPSGKNLKNLATERAALLDDKMPQASGATIMLILALTLISSVFFYGIWVHICRTSRTDNSRLLQDCHDPEGDSEIRYERFELV